MKGKNTKGGNKCDLEILDDGSIANVDTRLNKKEDVPEAQLSKYLVVNGEDGENVNVEGHGLII
jgi:hypothetical protein